LQLPVWYGLNLTLLGSVLALLVRQLWPVVAGASLKHRRWYAWGAGLLSLRFLISPIEYQSHDFIVFLGILLAIDRLAENRSGWGGAWVGLAAACKATPLLFLPVFVLQRRGQAVAGFVVALALATLLPDVLCPRDDGGLWGVAWYQTFVSKVGVGAPADAAGAWTSWNLLNQSLSGTLYRLSYPVPASVPEVSSVNLWSPTARTLKLVTLLLQLAVVGLVALVAWTGSRPSLPPEERRFRRLAEAAVVVCAMLLLSPMSSKQHFCVLVLPISVCLADFLFRRRDPFVAAALLTVLIGVIGAKDLVGRPLGNLLLAYGALTFCTAACLLASCRVAFSRDRDVRLIESQIPVDSGSDGIDPGLPRAA
jgi:hypothetical protein